MAANLNAGSDSILLGAGTFVLSFAGADETDGVTGDLNIKDAVLVQGAGQNLTIIDAEGEGGLDDRVLQIATGILAQINDLTIRGGFCPFRGGGVLTSGNVTMNRVTVTDNETLAWGGGIAAEGTLNLLDSIVSNNTAPRAGGIDSNGILVMEDSQVVGNDAIGGLGNGGGGLLLFNGNTTIRRSVIEGNSAFDLPGGGLYVYQGVLVIEDSSIVGNEDDLSAGGAGGIYNEGGDIDLINTTLAHNSSPFLGALYNNDGDVHFTNATIIRNMGLQTLGGLFNMTTLRDSVYDGDCGGNVTYVSEGGNVFASGISCGATIDDMAGVGDLLLSQVGNYGGSTPTAVPFAYSAVLDAARTCPPPDFDQRGLPRPVVAETAGALSGCDAGAVEAQSDELDTLFFDSFESGDVARWSAAVP
ncbi:MAG: choice-of-anchor Q domain-containing protein [Acidobacteriota bacterium]